MSRDTPIQTAMILAAGRGERMRPLTDTTPKPLLKAGDKSLIEWQITALVRAGVQRIVINHAWLGEQIESSLGNGARYRCELIYSAEENALETAGGIAKALPLLGLQPFIVVSGDIYTDYDYSQLPHDLGANAAHLVLVNNPPYHHLGDMGLIDGVVVPQAIDKLTYANIGVFNPNIFKSIYSFKPIQPQKLFPWLYQQGNISGEYYVGEWHNIGTPQQLMVLNQLKNNNINIK